MRRSRIASVLIGVASIFAYCGGVKAVAEPLTIALKSGESVDLQNVFWAINCRSLLKGPMTVEILEGPPEVTASIREQKIVPHIQNCANAINAGVLVLSAAKGISKKVEATTVLRVKYPAPDGDKQKAFEYQVILLP